MTNISDLPGFELLDFSKMTEPEKQAAFDAMTAALPGMNTRQKISAQLSTVWARDARGHLHLLPLSRRKLAGLGLQPGQLVPLKKVSLLARKPMGKLFQDAAEPALQIYQNARDAFRQGWQVGSEIGKAAGQAAVNAIKETGKEIWDFLMVCAGLKQASPPWTWKQCMRHAVQGLKQIASAIVETPLKVIGNILRNPVLGILTAPFTIIAGAAKAIDGAGMVAQAAAQATLRAWDDLDRLDTPQRTR